MARYGQAFKDQAVARLLPPESASLESALQGCAVQLPILSDNKKRLRPVRRRSTEARSWIPPSAS